MINQPSEKEKNSVKESQTRIDELKSEIRTLKNQNIDLQNRSVWIDFVTEAVISSDPEKLLLRSWNQAAEKIYGYKAEEVFGRTIIDVTKREYIDITRDKVLEIFYETGQWKGVVREYRKDGSPIYVFISVSLIKDENGKPVDVVAINQDITTEIEMIEVNTQQRKAFKLIAEVATSSGTIEDLCHRVLVDLVATLKFDVGSLRLLSPEKDTLHAAAVVGIKDEDIDGLAPPQHINDKYYLATYVARNREAIFAPDVSNHKISETHVERLSEIGIKSLISWPIIDTSEELIGVMLLAAYSPKVIKVENQQFFETVARLFAHLFKRKQAEEALRRSEEKYRSIFENITDTYYRADLGGRLTLASPSGLKVLGYDSYDEIIGKDIAANFYHKPKNRDLLTLKLAREGKVENYEVALKRKDGSKVLVEVNANFVYDSEGNRVAIEGIFRDISQRKKIEAELLKTQKLESIGILAGGLAHDFNNILTAILGNISIAQNLAVDNTKVIKRLARAADACLRAQDITQQLLTFSRGGEPIKIPADIGQIVSETAGFSTRGSNVRINLKINKSLWPAMVDEGQFSQAIQNLVINSVQAMPEGGDIDIKVKNHISLDQHSGDQLPGVEVKISDTGIGIDKRYIAKIFDPYFTTKKSGSGLGLTTTYSIINKHEGSISVESELGIGTTFTLWLPATPDLKLKKSISTHRYTSRRGKILVMDDEEIILDVSRYIFEELGYEYDCARHGHEAIEKFKLARKRNAPYDLLIIDLTIRGGMGGKETIRQLLEIDPSVKAIVSSGYSNDPVMANYQKHGFVGFLKKPYHMEQIKEILMEVFHSHSSE